MNIEYRYINKTILSDVIQNYTIYLFTVYEKNAWNTWSIYYIT